MAMLILTCTFYEINYATVSAPWWKVVESGHKSKVLLLLQLQLDQLLK